MLRASSITAHLEWLSYSLHIPEASYLSKPRHSTSPMTSPWKSMQVTSSLPNFPSYFFGLACFPLDGSVLTSFRSLLLEMNFLRLQLHLHHNFSIPLSCFIFLQSPYITWYLICFDFIVFDRSLVFLSPQNCKLYENRIFPSLVHCCILSV